MLKKLMQRLGRHRIILDRQSQEPYLERYYLLLKDRKHFPFNIFLHKFLKGDPDDVHDHPWPYMTIILKGGYWEWVPILNSLGEVYKEFKIWRGPGHIRICDPTSYHRIELEPGVTPWTLFFPGPHKREWGFLKDGKTWTHHERYLADKPKSKRKKKAV